MSKWENEKWFVSPLNYASEVTSKLAFPKRIQIHDVTLRDGEQQAGLAFQKEDKIRLAMKLAEAGVPRIEAGMPAVHPKDAEVIKELAAKKLPGTKIFTFARCMVEDIDRSADLGVDGVVVEIPAGEKILERCYGWSLEKAMDLSISATKHAHERGLHVTFFPIDATRADQKWYLDLIDKVATQGHMDSLAIVDTFGVCSPHAIKFMVDTIKSRVQKPLEAHFHDDFGMATANTIIALAAGVEVAHVSLTSIGERAGNASLEETVMTLLAMYGIDCGIKTEMLYPLARMAMDIAKINVRPNRPIIGDDTYRSESGIVAAWFRACKATAPCTLYPIHWKTVGRNEAELVLGKWSGKPTVEEHLERQGIKATDEQIMAILMKVKNKGYEKRGRLSDAEFMEIVNEVLKP